MSGLREQSVLKLSDHYGTSWKEAGSFVSCFIGSNFHLTRKKEKRL